MKLFKSRTKTVEEKQREERRIEQERRRRAVVNNRLDYLQQQVAVIRRDE
jgi:hypothetical protein